MYLSHGDFIIWMNYTALYHRLYAENHGLDCWWSLRAINDKLFLNTGKYKHGLIWLFWHEMHNMSDGYFIAVAEETLEQELLVRHHVQSNTEVCGRIPTHTLGCPNQSFFVSIWAFAFSFSNSCCFFCCLGFLFFFFLCKTFSWLLLSWFPPFLF